MNTTLIVGAGLPGILMSHLLLRNNKTFQGIAKEKQLNDFSFYGQLRVQLPESVEFLSSLGDFGEWLKSDECAKERKKGEWTEATGSYLEEELPLLNTPTYFPRCSEETVIQELERTIAEKFLVKKQVEHIDLKAQVASCEDGSVYLYDKLIWCYSLRELFKVTQSQPIIPLKIGSKKTERRVGIHVEMHLSQPLITQSHSIVFPFRYKEFRLRAIGIAILNEKNSQISHQLHWTVFVDKEAGDDREELAKIIRCFKREIQKEFSELKDLIVSEKIIFQPIVTNPSPAQASGLELFPNVYYLGSEIQLPNSNANHAPIDVLLENGRWLQNNLSPIPPSTL